VLPPILTLLLLAFAFGVGYRDLPQHRTLKVLVVAWALVMVTNFVVADVADDDDIGAFIFSALLVLVLCYGLSRLGGRWAHRGQ
jgi:hypothetical protein